MPFEFLDDLRVGLGVIDKPGLLEEEAQLPTARQQIAGNDTEFPLPTISAFTTSANPVAPNQNATLSFAYSDGTDWAISSSLDNSISPGSGSSPTGGSVIYRRDTAVGPDTLTLTVTGPCGVDTQTLVIN